MEKEQKIKYGWGIDETHCEAESYDTVEELLEYAQASWDDKDGNPFDEDCEYSGTIHVGVMEYFEPADFAPSLDSIADDMTDQFYSEHNIDDDADVQINNRKEAEQAWKEFVNKYFELPGTCCCNWFGLYDLEEHKWLEKYAGFDKHVKEGGV